MTLRLTLTASGRAGPSRSYARWASPEPKWSSLEASGVVSRRGPNHLFSAWRLAGAWSWIFYYPGTPCSIQDRVAAGWVVRRDPPPWTQGEYLHTSGCPAGERARKFLRMKERFDAVIQGKCEEETLPEMALNNS